MGNICHDFCPDFIGNFAELNRIDHPWIGTCPGNDQFGLAFKSQFPDLLVINLLSFLVHAIGNNVIGISGKVNRATMSQVPTVRQVHSENSISRFENCMVNRHIGLGAGMGLNIGVFGRE